MNIKNTVIGVGLVILGVAFGYIFWHQTPKKTLAGASYSAISTQTGESLAYKANLSSPIGQSTVDPNGAFVNNGLGDVVTSGTFGPATGQIVTNGIPSVNNFVGSTTLFSIQNPFGATSTLVFSEIYGTNAATSTSIYVGTSTSALGICYFSNCTNNISPSLINATSSNASTEVGAITAGENFNLVSGVTTGTNVNFVSPGTGSQYEITVAPNEYVVGYATSTITQGYNSNSISYITSATSTLAGTYSFEWYH